MSADSTFFALFTFCKSKQQTQTLRGSLLGYSTSNAEFQHAIKHTMKENEMFKAIPLQFCHRSVGRMFETIVAHKGAGSLLCTEVENLSFAVRIKVVPYPEASFVV
jgi:hypothetical protein